MNIVVFWDSIARWAYDRQQWWWVERLKLWWFDQENCFVYNQGVSAHASRELLKRVEVICQMKTFDVAIVAIGTNDSWYQDGKHNVDSEDFKINLDQIFGITSKYAQKIIFIWLTKVDESKTVPIPRKPVISYTNKNIKLYDDIIQEFTRQHNLWYVPLYDLLDNEDLDDWLHPNTQGHQKIFERVLTYLQDNKIL